MGPGQEVPREAARSAGEQGCCGLSRLVANTHRLLIHATNPTLPAAVPVAPAPAAPAAAVG